MNSLNPFLIRYGFSANDFALLVAGGHAIAGAANDFVDSGIPTFTFSFVTSIVQYIEGMYGLQDLSSWYGKPGSVLGRLLSGLFCYLPQICCSILALWTPLSLEKEMLTLLPWKRICADS